MAKFKISRIKADNADADQITECFRNAQTIAEVKPLHAKDRITVDVSQYSMGQFGTWAGMCRSGMDVKIIKPAEVFVIYLPESGVLDIDIGKQRHVSGDEAGYIGDFSMCERIQFRDGRSHTGIAISKAALTQQLSELIDAPVVRVLEFIPKLHDDAYALRRIAALSTLLWNTLHEAETVNSVRFVESLFRSIGSLLLESVPHNYAAEVEGKVSGALPRHIKKAIEYMIANISQPLTISEIAAEAGVSIRNLQQGFRDFKDATPLEYARRIRLEGVRKMLIDNPDHTPVLDIARQWGFQHMGRFAALYKEAFGELPSQTGG